MFAKFALTATVLAATTAFAIDAQYSGQADTKPAATAGTAAKAPATIVKTAQDAGQFKVLCELLVAANLVDTLNSAGPFTVFAPTDAAFGKLPPETLASLKKDPKALGEILTYHVVAGNNGAAEVMKAKELVTVQGQPIMITVKEGKVMLNNGATVTTADVKASNGVIHVIDTVITPPAKKDASSAAGAKS
jgi:transforming growth factor-beta-induced protein